MENDKKPLLRVNDLVIHYVTDDGTCEAVNGISFELERGETLGLVGETGAGKTTVALGILGLVPDPPGKVIRGSIEFDGVDLMKLSKNEMRRIRGKRISMIFQDPMTALNPIDPVGDQVCEVIRLHDRISRAEARLKAQKMLEMVGIPAERYSEYPHQFSGGMKQRVVIAISLACNPELLIADEPTTALDVTIQAQVLDKLNELQRNLGTAMILITHDLGVVAEMCRHVAVVYAGEIVEYGDVFDIYDHPTHPYTNGLFGSLPSVAENKERLIPIPGLMPDPMNLPEGCSFYDRCPEKTEACLAPVPLYEVSDKHLVRCVKCASGKKGGI